MLKSGVLDIEKCKSVDRSPLEQDWLTASHGKGELWHRDEDDAQSTDKNAWRRRSQAERVDLLAVLGHVFYVCLLLVELGMWIKVIAERRRSPTNQSLFEVFLPLALPTFVLPGLGLVHTLTKGRLSTKVALLLVVPPSPIVVHSRLIYLAVLKKNREKWTRISRIGGIVQACVMSYPLIIISFKTVLLEALENDIVDTGLVHKQIHEQKFQFIATIISLCNLIVAAYRYNERSTGRAVAVLVGIPFLVSNIIFRLIGFTFLVSFFEAVWILLCLCIMLAMSALSVQVSSKYTICGRVARAVCVFGDDDPRSDEKKPSMGSSLLLSIGGVLLPLGYTRDCNLGHVMGRGWRLILGNTVGTMAILSTVISRAIVMYIPNTVSVRSLVNMFINMAAMEVTVRTGGKEMVMKVPETQVKIIADTPLETNISLNHHDDIYISYIVPAALCLLCIPFTLLRILLVGWDCRLERYVEDDDFYPERNRNASSARSCCAVLWSISALLSFIILTIFLLGLLIYGSILAHVEPISA